MITVGVFGDSFGYEGSIFGDKSITYDSAGESWVSLLRNHVKITNYCEPGSDLYFSYKNFISNYKKFDKNIFLVTNFNRFSFKFKDKFIHAHSYDSASVQIKKCTNEKQKALKASMDYFLYLQDDEKDSILRNLYLNDMILKNSNTSFIKCFGENSLNEIMQKENQSWNLPSRYTFKEKFIDIRESHLTKENNKLLYNKVLKWLIKDIKIEIDTDDFVAPSLDKKETYILKL